MRTLTFFLTLMFAAASLLYAQQPKANNTAESGFLDFQNLRTVQDIPKETRDNILQSLEKMEMPAGTYTINGRDISKELSPDWKNIFKKMGRLFAEVLENPDPALIEKNQLKMDDLMQQLDDLADKIDDDMDYAQEKQEIVDEYRSGEYDNKWEKKSARMEMKAELAELKRERKLEKKEAAQERKEELRDAREGYRVDKKEIRLERKEERKESRQEIREARRAN